MKTQDDKYFMEAMKRIDGDITVQNKCQKICNFIVKMKNKIILFKR